MAHRAFVYLQLTFACSRGPISALLNVAYSESEPIELDKLQAYRAPGLFHDEPEPARPHQQFRLANFANYTAEKIRAAHNCAFSKLDHQELVQCVTAWYESCAQAMLRGNYSLIDQWVCRQGRIATDHRLELEDLLELLRICRSSAIVVEQWDPDVLLSVDDVINEALHSRVENPAWKISADVDYRGRNSANPPSIEGATKMTEEAALERACERRVADRASLQLPIRVTGNGITGYRLDLVVQTESFSSNGLYFLAYEPFSAGLRLQVRYPSSKDPGAVNKAFSAKVVRVDRRIGRSRGIAIQFVVPIPENATRRSV
jgi:hypothetical protein